MHIRAYLQKTRKTCTAFAKEIGVTHSAVVKYAGGKIIPRPPIMARIQKATDGAVMANDFFGLNETPPSKQKKGAA